MSHKHTFENWNFPSHFDTKRDIYGET